MVSLSPPTLPRLRLRLRRLYTALCRTFHDQQALLQLQVLCSSISQDTAHQFMFIFDRLPCDFLCIRVTMRTIILLRRSDRYLNER